MNERNDAQPSVVSHTQEPRSRWERNQFDAALATIGNIARRGLIDLPNREMLQLTDVVNSSGTPTTVIRYRHDIPLVGLHVDDYFAIAGEGKDGQLSHVQDDLSTENDCLETGHYEGIALKRQELAKEVIESSKPASSQDAAMLNGALHAAESACRQMLVTVQ